MGQVQPSDFLVPGAQKLTPAELGMSDEARSFLPTKGPGFWERQWDRIATTMAMPGDEIAREIFTQLAEVPANLGAGLVASGYDYAFAAKSSAEWVANKAGLTLDERSNFITAAMNKYKHNPIEPTSKEWEDQLFYLLGYIAPDVLLTWLGGGIVGGFAAASAKTAGMSQKAANISKIFGRIIGDTSANVGTFIAHEQGQAVLQGRESDFSRATGDALKMAAMMSTIARTSQVLGLKRRYGALLTGTAMHHVSAAHGASDDEVWANTVMGGLFGLAVTKGTTGPVDIGKWVVANKKLGLPVNGPTINNYIESYVKEFHPTTWERVYVDEARQDAKVHELGADQLAPSYYSPKDNFLLYMAQVTKKDPFGHSDDQLVWMMKEIAEQDLAPHSMISSGKQDMKPEFIKGATEEASLASARIGMDTINSVNNVWLSNHPKYKSFHPQHKWDKRLPRKRKALTKVSIIDKDVWQQEQTGQTHNLEGDVTIWTDTNGNVANAGGERLKLHELSYTEAHMLFGKSGSSKAINEWNQSVKDQHRLSVEDAAKSYTLDNPKSWPHERALDEHGLLGKYGMIHRKTEFARITNDNQGAGALAIRLKEAVGDSKKAGVDVLAEVDAKTKQGWFDLLYHGFVATEGRLYDRLEKDPITIPVRNAHQMRYMTKDVVQEKFNQLDTDMGWNDWQTPYRDWFDTYYKLETEMDFKQRSSAWPPKVRNMWEGVQGANAKAVQRNILQAVDGYEGGSALFLKRIEAVKTAFDDVLLQMRDEGFITPETFKRLQPFKYSPQKLIREIEKETYFYNIGVRMIGDKPDKVSVEYNRMKDLSKFSMQDQFIDIEYLLKNHISMYQHIFDKNKFFQEAAKVSDSTDYFFRATKGSRQPRATDKSGINFKKYSYQEGGKRKYLWIEGSIAESLEKPETMFDLRHKDKLGWLAGAHSIRLSAVALNPVFSFATHILDMLHVFTHHGKTGYGVAPLKLWNFEVFNKERGIAPFMQNFASAWRHGELYKDYVQNHGTTATLISHITNKEMIRNARQLPGDHLGTFRNLGKPSKIFNSTLQFWGKFGHTMEVATRMTEVDMLMSTGKFSHKSQATAESVRRLNYHRRGQWMKFIDTIIPFANASAQILASNLSEIKNLKNTAHTAAFMTQLSLGLAWYRYEIEKDFPNFMKDVPWPTRMRYFIIPTSMTVTDPETREVRGVFFKVKKHWSPVFSIIDAQATWAMDKYLYGEEGLPPISFMKRNYEALRTSTPLELRSMIPPVANAITQVTMNTTVDSGRKVYKGPARRLEDEINTKMTGGKETHGLAMLVGDLTGASPARTQAAFSSYIADNPLGFFVSKSFDMAPQQQQSILNDVLKFAFSRKFMGTTRPGWAHHERGQKYQEEAGSSEYRELDSLIEYSILRYHDNQINFNQLRKEISDATKNSSIEFQVKATKDLKKEIRSRELFRGWTKRYGREEVYKNLGGSMAFWLELRRIPTAEHKADFYYQEWLQTEDDWKDKFKQYAATRGLFSDPFVTKHLKKLQRKGEKL